MRHIHVLQVKDAPPQFTVGEVADVIRRIKSSKALGSDGISMAMLKQLDIPGVEYMAKAFNLSMTTLTVSEAWKMGRVVPY